MMKKVKVGVFGGARGYTMMDQLMNNPEAELVAVCDKYMPLLERITTEAQKRGLSVTTYTDFEDFIQHDMDAVVLANYANEHAPYAVRCLDAGKHVMSEVLPAETPAQAIELIEAVERSGLIYSYAENYCYMKAPFEMRMKYALGEIGEVTYCEGEYIHDCSGIWPQITYGEENHWRNRMFPTFYCTHSFGPLMTITGLRPVKVVGFEVPGPNDDKHHYLGYPFGAGVEMVTMENGAVCKSVHGTLKREPGSINYQVYGTKGMMESARYNSHEFNLYKEYETLYCQGAWENYDPDLRKICPEMPDGDAGHGGSDYFTTKFFVDKILGKENGKWCIDVYAAVDMGMVGIMAYRSILAGNTPMDIPDFRIKENRDAYRNDNSCTNPYAAPADKLPRSSLDLPEYPQTTYDRVRSMWLGEQPLEYKKEG